MSSITATAVKSLRDRTGAGMMDCKKALQETGGDEEQAIDLLRQWGAAKAAKRTERAMTEGVVAVAAAGGGVGMVSVSSETDFVARNEEFRGFAERLAGSLATSEMTEGEVVAGRQLLAEPAFASFRSELEELRARIGENLEVQEAVRIAGGPDGAVGSYVHFGSRIGVLVDLEGGDGDVSALARELAMHIAAANPMGISPDDIPEADRERERAVLVEQAKAEGKPEHIAEKIVEGRMRKYFEENTLLMQRFVKDPDRTIQALLAEVGPDLQVRKFFRFAIGD